MHKSLSNLGTQFEKSVYTSCVHLCKFIIPRAVAVLDLIVVNVKMAKNWKDKTLILRGGNIPYLSNGAPLTFY